ncbi:hypothetical protein GCM10027444_28370 [Actinopolyspora lacussalsi]
MKLSVSSERALSKTFRACLVEGIQGCWRFEGGQCPGLPDLEQGSYPVGEVRLAEAPHDAQCSVRIALIQADQGVVGHHEPLHARVPRYDGQAQGFRVDPVRLGEPSGVDQTPARYLGEFRRGRFEITFD